MHPIDFVLFSNIHLRCQENWYEGYEFNVLVPPGVRKAIKLIEMEHNYLKEKSGCSHDQSWYDCYANLAESLPFDDCPVKCLAHSIHYNR